MFDMILRGGRGGTVNELLIAIFSHHAAKIMPLTNWVKGKKAVSTTRIPPKLLITLRNWLSDTSNTTR